MYAEHEDLNRYTQAVADKEYCRVHMAGLCGAVFHRELWS